MTTRTILCACTAALLLASACSTASEPTPDPEASEQAGSAPPTVGAEQGSERAALPKQEWIDTRVEQARESLDQSEAGRLVWRSIEAHGGLQTWYENGPLYFRFNYQPVGEGTARDTYQLVDTWSARAVHELAADRTVQFGWDGEQAWVHPADAELELNPRFWALTPYYFVGMPFVLGDPGVNLELEGEQQLDEQTYQVVRATFDDEAGDAPDDYYVLYFHTETHRLEALRYVVSYPGFFPEGGSSPEKLMRYEGEQTVDGITFAERYPTYAWDEERGQPGQKVTDIELDEVEFRPEAPASLFEVPGGARIVEGY